MIKPVVEEIDALVQPQVIFGKLKDFPYSFFLDSSQTDTRLGRFSLMGCDPFLLFRSKLGTVTLESKDGKAELFKANPFSVLKDLLKKYKMPSPDERIPMASGAVGYLSYDMKDYLEVLPDHAANDLGLADCMLGFYDSVAVFDHLKNKAYVAGSGKGIDRLKEIISGTAGAAAKKTGSKRISSLRSNFSKASYVEAIGRAKRYIKKGDIYQVNLSQRFETEIEVEPFELYLRLRQVSPAPFSSFLDFGEVSVLSSSPERFLLKKGPYVETRPIKGTRPRGIDDFSDILLGEELKKSPKDNAEHIMIVDLERNDLGRICEPGSVFWTEKAVIEKYANVSHLVSTISGKLKKGVDAADCLMATFPGGSITGAPKIRSMEIIEELEPVKRSVYTGAIGYLSFDGNMDTSIVIRTFIIKNNKAYFSVGGGIVADSVPEEEYAETIDKARGLLAALGVETPKSEAIPA
jgi:para-aminobenzoate synthetase component I